MNSQLSAPSRSQIRNRMIKLAGENIRKYPQWTCPVSATNSMIGAIVLTLSSRRENAFDDSDCFDGYTSSPIVITALSDNHPIIIRYFPGIIRFTQGICRFSSTARKTNRPKIDRRNHRIDRSGRGGEQTCAGPENRCPAQSHGAGH
jgi:hypothetical protein